MKRRLMAVVLLLACGNPPQWDLKMPVSVVLDIGEERASKARPVVASALAQLGAIEGDGGLVTIRMQMATSIECDGRFGWVPDADSTVINLCPLTFQPNAQILNYTVRHELGHVFGADHLPCESKAIMAPNFGCSSPYTAYTTADIDEICGAKRLTGGVCGLR